MRLTASKAVSLDSELWSRWMNGQHLRALPVEELAPMVGSALVEAGVCKDAGGAFANGAASLLQGSLELVTDVVSQTPDVLGYKVNIVYEKFSLRLRLAFPAESATPCYRKPQEHMHLPSKKVVMCA